MQFYIHLNFASNSYFDHTYLRRIFVGTITEENVTEVDVDKYVSIENEAEKTPKKSKVKFGAVTEIENEGFSSDGEAPAGEDKKSEKKSKDESSGDADFEEDGEQ